MKPFTAIACCLALCAHQALASPPLSVEIPTAGISSAPAPLSAFIFRPNGGTAKHPAVVMVHGCGGAYGRDGKLNARHAMWGEYLASQGYVALMLDSFGARGIKEICTTKFSERTLKESDRVGDAYAALAYLRQRPDVDAKRIAMLGWSHGAGVTLDTITNRPTDAGFSAAIAFYPGCTSRNKKPETFHPYAHVLIG